MTSMESLRYTFPGLSGVGSFAPVLVGVVASGNLEVLVEPHVVEWWEPAPTLEAVEADYLPRLSSDYVLPLDASPGVVQFIAYEGDEPFGD